MSLHGTVVFIPWHVLYQKLLNGNEQNLLLLVYKISPVWGKTFCLAYYESYFIYTASGAPFERDCNPLSTDAPDCSPLPTCAPDGHLQFMMIPDAV